MDNISIPSLRRGLQDPPRGPVLRGFMADRWECLGAGSPAHTSQPGSRRFAAGTRARVDDSNGIGEQTTAVVVDAYPLWIEAVEDILDGLGLVTAGKATSPSDGLRL